jgi:protein O-mannosyl-transferase
VKISKTARNMLICAGLLILTVGSFQGLKHAGFVNYDDPAYVTRNAIVQQGVTLENARWAFTTFHYNNWHPLTWLSYMADFETFGSHPRGFHATNLALHVANSLLLFFLLARLTSAPWASAFVAAFFAVHPLHVESVAWISERKDVLSTLFWLLTMWAYTRYAEHRRLVWYLATAVFLALGLMSKSMLVTLPFVLLLLDLWPLRRLVIGTPGWVRQASRLAAEKVPFLVLSAIASYLTYIAQGEAVRTTRDLALTHRLENTFVSYGRYIAKSFWPVDLTVFYPHPVGWPAAMVAGTLLLVTALTFVAILTVRTRPYLFTGWFWFLGTLVPVIGLVQIGNQSIADRYMYVPLIGLSIALIWGLRDLILAKPALKNPIIATACIAVVLCAHLTTQQVKHWRDSIALFTHCERLSGPHIVILNNLSAAFLEQGRTNEANERVLTAVRTVPHEQLTWWNAGNMAMREGKHEEAVAYYQEGLRRKPPNPELHLNIGIALARQGKLQDAIEQYQAALALDPNYLEGRLNLASTFVRIRNFDAAATNYAIILRAHPNFAPAHFNAANLFMETGATERAIHHLQMAVHLQPDLTDAHRQLGLLLVKAGRPAEARRHLEQSLIANPNDPIAQASMGAILAGTTDAAGAITSYRLALQQDPNLTIALNNLTWLLATHPKDEFRNGPEAVRLGERAVQLTERREVAMLGTLAAAYAEAGRFEDAIVTAEEAVKLAESQGLRDLENRNRELLVLYRSGKPWREPR